MRTRVRTRAILSPAITTTHARALVSPDKPVHPCAQSKPPRVANRPHHDYGRTLRSLSTLSATSRLNSLSPGAPGSSQGSIQCPATTAMRSCESGAALVASSTPGAGTTPSCSWEPPSKVFPKRMKSKCSAEGRTRRVRSETEYRRGACPWLTRESAFTKGVIPRASARAIESAPNARALDRAIPTGRSTSAASDSRAPAQSAPVSCPALPPISEYALCASILSPPPLLTWLPLRTPSLATRVRVAALAPLFGARSLPWPPIRWSVSAVSARPRRMLSSGERHST